MTSTCQMPYEEEIGRPNAAKYGLTFSDVKTSPGTRIRPSFSRNLAAGTGPGGNPGPFRARIGGTGPWFSDTAWYAPVRNAIGNVVSGVYGKPGYIHKRINRNVCVTW